MYTLTLQDDLSGKLDELEALLDGPILRDAAAGSAASALREHFNARNQTPNRLGGERTNYWAGVADSTAHEVTDDGFLLLVDHVGARLHHEGGTVRPVEAKLLAIPAAPDAHGRRPREFADLAPFFFRGRKAVGGLQDASGRVLFWLTPEAEIPPDPSVIPPDADLIDAALLGARDALQRLFSG